MVLFIHPYKLSYRRTVSFNSKSTYAMYCVSKLSVLRYNIVARECLMNVNSNAKSTYRPRDFIAKE